MDNGYWFNNFSLCYFRTNSIYLLPISDRIGLLNDQYQRIQYFGKHSYSQLYYAILITGCRNADNRTAGLDTYCHFLYGRVSGDGTRPVYFQHNQPRQPLDYGR
ncbi:hypothetical protein GCM10027592_09960 [Spirosoma flavus]